VRTCSAGFGLGEKNIPGHFAHRENNLVRGHADRSVAFREIQVEPAVRGEIDLACLLDGLLCPGIELLSIDSTTVVLFGKEIDIAAVGRPFGWAKVTVVLCDKDFLLPGN